MKILQIVAAQPGWRVVAEDANDRNRGDPVAVWALVDDEGEAVVGLTAGGDGDGYALLEPTIGFRRYCFDPDDG